ncbi:unnamed protein product [Parascedosporium putredinis]|uniref:PHD-type domain-containing protein n=1 Tax=Parascedosporium putredinis TaxID=1442378 RepID=A0A9P1GW96_9PEZI|nr:unnamed protein product [Parascedosporium putredinis]CAI7988576.1 unnamed protein product [Parascedosporium putredinis]
MSGDQLAATSFGDPNAQPPTPRQTPTCVAFPSPDFETPQLFQKTPFEDGGTSRHSSSSWTSGPGNDISPFSSTAPVHAAESHLFRNEPAKATHGVCDCDQRPKLGPSTPKQASTAPATYADRNTSAVGKQGDRKPPSGPTATTMQDDQGFGHPDFLGATATPHQQHSGDLTAAFAASGHDVFGYPLRSVWDPLSAARADPSRNRLFDWNSNPALFQDPTVTAMANNVAANGVPQPSAEIPVSGDLAGPYLAGSDAAFTLSPSGGVDPGLLFSRPPSSGMDVSFNQAGHADPAETSRTRTCSAECCVRPSIKLGPVGSDFPLKLHHRLTSLSSIPESNGPRTRTSVKFTIDARGRAHAETTTVAEESSPMRRASRDSGSSGRRAPAVLGSSGSDDSDTDDEPIIIQAATLRDESEAETVVDSRSDREGSAGDAASELRKMVEDRQNKRVASQRAQRMGSSSANGTFEWGGASVVSPTHITDAIPTPLTGGRRLNIRCICHRNDQGSAADTFMVQCEACEMWLHGRCTKITRREMPPVYICAFCANTPNMRGGRLRDTGRAGSSSVAMGSGMASSSHGHGHGHGHGTSPLAHKSFKSFR